MKALLLTGLFTAISSLAYAGGACCATNASTEKAAKAEKLSAKPAETQVEGKLAQAVNSTEMAELKKAAAAGCPFSAAKLAKMEKAGADCEEAAAACAEGAKNSEKMADSEAKTEADKEVSATEIEGAENKM